MCSVLTLQLMYSRIESVASTSCEKQKGKKVCREFKGYQYDATGVFGYSFRENNKEVVNLSMTVAPEPDIYIEASGEKFCHEKYHGDITIFPGLKRTVVNRKTDEEIYYEVTRDLNYFIHSNKGKLFVKQSVTNWEIYTYYAEGNNSVTMRVAEINRTNPLSAEKFEEYFDYTEYCTVSIQEWIDEYWYPFIMAIPVLGF